MIRQVKQVEMYEGVRGDKQRLTQHVIAANDQNALYIEDGDYGITWVTGGQVRCIPFSHCKAWTYDTQGDERGRPAKAAASRQGTEKA